MGLQWVFAYICRENIAQVGGKIQHIAVAGNIGAGKTSLCELLSRHYGWKALYESSDDNPYLVDFYHDMRRWAFNLQVYFLHKRLKQIIEIRKGEETVVQDRTIYEDATIFAPNLYEMGLIEKRDFENYLELFDTMTAQIQPPDLLIYLRASIPTLVEHIQTRGREYEGNMSIDYLKRLNKRYESWIADYDKGPKLIIEVDTIDFINREEDKAKVISMIDSQIHGLFS